MFENPNFLFKTSIVFKFVELLKLKKCPEMLISPKNFSAACEVLKPWISAKERGKKVNDREMRG